MQSLSLLQTIAIWIIPILLAITLHEAAHAWVANKCGDSTAKVLGRLSMNPLRHIDPIGTVIVPIIIALLSGFQFVFGWAKPVPINWLQLKNPRRDMILVALAGPMSNVVMAVLWALCAKIGLFMDPSLSSLALFMVLTGKAGIMINLVLALLNLVPIPPLDGSRVVACLLPPTAADQYMRLEPYGFLILLVLLVTGVLSRLLFPLLVWTLDLFNTFL